MVGSKLQVFEDYNCGTAVVVMCVFIGVMSTMRAAALKPAREEFELSSGTPEMQHSALLNMYKDMNVLQKRQYPFPAEKGRYFDTVSWCTTCGV